MTRFLKSDAGAVVLWVVATVVLAAAITPWLFAWGKEFAAAYHGNGGLSGWLAGSCERARFSRYFNRAMLIAAGLMLVPLLWRVRQINRSHGGTRPPAPWAHLGWKTGIGHAVAGFTAAAAMLWLLGLAVQAGGAFTASGNEITAKTFLLRTVVPAIGASVVEEWIFRALLIGLWLRITGAWMACIGTSLVFAFVHFLEPPRGAEMADPRAWTAGFELLGLVLRNYLNPQFIAAELLTLFTVGMALAWARLRTGSLWLPIGMHAGWIFAFKSFNLFHHPTPENGLGALFVGDSLKEGILPLATLALTWLLIAGALRWIPRGRFDGQRW